jgi:hypothetical protein
MSLHNSLNENVVITTDMLEVRIVLQVTNQTILTLFSFHSALSHHSITDILKQPLSFGCSATVLSSSWQMRSPQ